MSLNDIYWQNIEFESSDNLNNLMLDGYGYSGLNITKYYSLGHYVQSSKAMLFNDWQSWDKIMATKNKNDILALGKKITNFDQLTWNKYKPIIIKTGILSMNNIKHDSWKNYKLI